MKQERGFRNELLFTNELLNCVKVLWKKLSHMSRLALNDLYLLKLDCPCFELQSPDCTVEVC